LNNAYQYVQKGDNDWMCYQPEQQTTTLRLNDKLLLEMKNSAIFAKIHMGMWLSENKLISSKLQKKFLSSLPK